MKKILFIPIWCYLLLAYSCKTSKIDTVEPVKDISGKWKIAKVVQNGVDVSHFVNMNDFTVDFTGNTYMLNGKFPFLVYQNGTWAFNDPSHPFTIAFTPAGSSNAVSTKLLMPLVDGNYQLIMNFTNRCEGLYEHSYQYTFKQIAQ